MRAILLGLLAVAGIAFIATPVSVSPASAQVVIDTPAGGMRVGPSQRRYRDHDRRGHRSYDRRCRTVIIQRYDGSVRKIRRCR
jgi:hypothetical protein